MALTPNLSTTFPYQFDTHVRYGAYPECFDEAHPQELHGPPQPGCGNNTHAAVTKPAATARLLRWLSHTTFPCCRGCHSMPSQVLTWLRDIRGRRLDCANSYARAALLHCESATSCSCNRRYYNQKSVGAAIRASGVRRHELFVLSKVGPTFPLGYNDTLQQVTCDRHVSCHHCA